MLSTKAKEKISALTKKSKKKKSVKVIREEGTNASNTSKNLSLYLQMESHKPDSAPKSENQNQEEGKSWIARKAPSEVPRIM